MPAFEVNEFSDSQNFGENVFRFFYAIGSSLGIAPPPTKTILAYVSIPYSINVFTVMYPFYKDFKENGLLFFGVFFGVFSQYIYINAKIKNGFYLIIYTLLFLSLVFQFFADIIFSNLSYTIQYIIISRLSFKKI